MVPLATDALREDLRAIYREAQAQIDRLHEVTLIERETHTAGSAIFERYQSCHEAVVIQGDPEHPELRTAGQWAGPVKTSNPSESLLREDLVALQAAIVKLLAAMDRAWPS